MKSPRFLTEAEALDLLAHGKPLQQWISVRERDGFRFIRWVSVEHDGAKWLVFEKESLDDGRAGNRDITAFFNDLDPDYPEGASHECSTPQHALNKCLELGCAGTSFVPANGIQGIYETYTANNGVPAKAAGEYFTAGGP